MPRLKTFGCYRPECVSWNSIENQNLRFEIIEKIIPHKNFSGSICDIGCGVGDLYGHLFKNGYRKILYQSIDILQEMLSGARKKYPEAIFKLADFMADNWHEPADFLVCSGGLNMVFSDILNHELYLKYFIEKMFKLCQKGIAFNMLSIKGKYQFVEDERFYYAEPQVWLNICRQLSPRSSILENYLEHDFTIFMLK